MDLNLLGRDTCVTDDQSVRRAANATDSHIPIDVGVSHGSVFAARELTNVVACPTHLVEYRTKLVISKSPYAPGKVDADEMGNCHGTMGVLSVEVPRTIVRKLRARLDTALIHTQELGDSQLDRG